MVTAIVIPIICLYFYWLTKKEMKDIHQKWLNLEWVKEEAVLCGTISHLHTEKQKYYYYKYIYVIDIRLETEQKTIKVKKIIPLKKQVELPSLHRGDKVRLYGAWEGDVFLINRIEK